MVVYVMRDPGSRPVRPQPSAASRSNRWERNSPRRSEPDYLVRDYERALELAHVLGVMRK